MIRDRPLRTFSSTVRVDNGNYSVLLATPVGNAQEVVTRFGWLLFASIPAAIDGSRTQRLLDGADGRSRPWTRLRAPRV